VIVTIVLPLPAPALSPNARVHWAKKAKATKAYRNHAWSEAKTATWDGSTYRPPRWERAEVRATFYFPDRRRRDRDNMLASLKSAFDGIADAGIVVNDSGLIPAPPEVRVDKTGIPRVIITIRPLP